MLNYEDNSTRWFISMFVSYLQKADQQILQLFNSIPLPEQGLSTSVSILPEKNIWYLVAPNAKYAQRPSHLESQCSHNIFLAVQRSVTWSEVQIVHVCEKLRFMFLNHFNWKSNHLMILISGGIWKWSWHVCIEAVWHTVTVLDIQVMSKLVFL